MHAYEVHKLTMETQIRSHKISLKKKQKEFKRHVETMAYSDSLMAHNGIFFSLDVLTAPPFNTGEFEFKS